jgi:hypothetical protein
MRKWMVVAWMLVAGTCLAQQIDLKSLDKFAALAKSKTEINMDESMVKSAGDFLNENNKEEAQVKAITKDLKGFFMRAYEFPQKGMFKLEDLKPITDQLKGPGWASFLRVQEDDEQVEIWMHRTNGQMDGFLMIAAEGSEIFVMNALGVANLSDLSALGKLGELAGEAGNKVFAPPSNQPAPAPGTTAPKPGTAAPKDED